METKRPDREPDIQAHNIQIVYNANNEPSIQYQLYYKREQHEEWIIPIDPLKEMSEFDPPEWFKDGIDIVAWSVDISTTKKKNYDWVWCEKMDSYLQSKQTPMTRRIKKKQKLQQLDTLKTNFDQLFDIIKKGIDDEI